MPVEFKVYGPPAASVVELHVHEPEPAPRPPRPAPQLYRITWADGSTSDREFRPDDELLAWYLSRAADPDHGVASVEQVSP